MNEYCGEKNSGTVFISSILWATLNQYCAKGVEKQPRALLIVMI